jgi:hypothetical protein
MSKEARLTWVSLLEVRATLLMLFSRRIGKKDTKHCVSVWDADRAKIEEYILHGGIDEETTNNGVFMPFGFSFCARG